MVAVRERYYMLTFFIMVIFEAVCYLDFLFAYFDDFLNANVIDHKLNVYLLKRICIQIKKNYKDWLT